MTDATFEPSAQKFWNHLLIYAFIVTTVLHVRWSVGHVLLYGVSLIF